MPLPKGKWKRAFNCWKTAALCVWAFTNSTTRSPSSPGRVPISQVAAARSENTDFCQNQQMSWSELALCVFRL